MGQIRFKYFRPCILFMINEKDRKIIDLLREDGKHTARQISEKTGMPITTVHNRIKKLEKDGVIKGYTILLDRKKLGRGLQAFINISVNYALPNGTKLNQEELAKKMLRMPEVDECHIMTGTTDILLKVSAADVEELNNFVIHKLRALDGISDTVTGIVLKEVS